jgi:hypothetical protein
MFDVAVPGFIVAILGLGATAYNIWASRRLAEINSLLSLTRDYASYAASVKIVESSPSAVVARRAFVDMANYIENLCSIVRRIGTSSLIRENIEALVSDHIAESDFGLSYLGLDYSELLKSYGYGTNSFVDTRWFIEKHRRLIASKRQLLHDTHPPPADPPTQPARRRRAGRKPTSA